MKYQKTFQVSGAWVKTKDLTATKAKIVSETEPQPSSFLNKDGSPKTQDVCKVLFQGDKEPVNVALNRATINGLVEAFGEDSNEWIGKVLSVITEKIRVGGKANIALYLIADGYEKIDDEMGYAIIQKKKVAFEDSFPSNSTTERPEEVEIKPEDIPF